MNWESQIKKTKNVILQVLVSGDNDLIENPKQGNDKNINYLIIITITITTTTLTDSWESGQNMSYIEMSNLYKKLTNSSWFTYLQS